MTIKKMSAARAATFGVLAVTLLAAVTLPYIPAALADDTECTGPLGPGTFDNIVVPSGDCHLAIGTVVKGNVKQTGGNFFANAVKIHGNLQAQGGSDTILQSSKVGGNIQVEKTTRVVDIQDNWIREDVQIKDKPSGCIYVDHNTIGENFQADQNKLGVTCEFGDIIVLTNWIGEDLQEEKNTSDFNLIADNTIGGNLQCKENFVPPDNGGSPNTTAGNEEDQCAGL